MARPPKDDVRVQTFADHELLRPPHRLVKAISRSAPGDEDPVARAQAALDALAGDFPQWMRDECDRLDAARRRLDQSGPGREVIDAIFRAAHDIKGDAATLGFPLVAPIAQSLCRLIEHTPQPAAIPRLLLDQHIDGMRAIVREYARADIADMAAALNHRLQTVTREFLEHENRDRPGYLDGVFTAPPGNDGG